MMGVVSIATLSNFWTKFPENISRQSFGAPRMDTFRRYLPLWSSSDLVYRAVPVPINGGVCLCSLGISGCFLLQKTHTQAASFLPSSMSFSRTLTVFLCVMLASLAFVAQDVLAARSLGKSLSLSAATG